MAEVMLRDKLETAGVTGEWRVLSAGTWAQNGLPASEHGVAIMLEKGLNLEDHSSQEVNAALLEQSDLVLTMTAGHAEALRTEFPEHANKVFLLTEMAGLPYDVRDPYGGPVEEYRSTAQELERLIETGLEKIIRLADSPG
jgi:protein-tyrosine-phosphatase